MSVRHRVVITGVGMATPIGHDLQTVCRALRSGRHGIRVIDDWDRIAGLRPRLGGVVENLDVDRRYPRKKVRAMGRVTRLATYATEQAIAMAGLPADLLTSGQVGIAYGSTLGSSQALEDFCGPLFQTYDLTGLSATSFLRFMSHTCAANLAQFFGLRGRVIPTTSACTSGSQAIGFAYETIQDGRQDIMLCGGAEELHAVTAAIFDMFGATSNGSNEDPERAPRPFDRDRDGLVIGEGAATLVLERGDRALARGATILGEVIGFGTNCDGRHITAPSQSGMREAMLLGLRDAGVTPGEVDYISAHGTATILGDIAESQATAEVFGTEVPIASTKGATGHTLGACGAIESVFCLGMMGAGFLAPGRNLQYIDPRCARLDYVRTPREHVPEIVVNNNFAFGGINTSLVLRHPKYMYEQYCS